MSAKIVADVVAHYASIVDTQHREYIEANRILPICISNFSVIAPYLRAYRGVVSGEHVARPDDFDAHPVPTLQRIYSFFNSVKRVRIHRSESNSGSSTTHGGAELVTLDLDLFSGLTHLEVCGLLVGAVEAYGPGLGKLVSLHFSKDARIAASFDSRGAFRSVRTVVLSGCDALSVLPLIAASPTEIILSSCFGTGSDTSSPLDLPALMAVLTSATPPSPLGTNRVTRLDLLKCGIAAMDASIPLDKVFPSLQELRTSYNHIGTALGEFSNTFGAISAISLSTLVAASCSLPNRVLQPGILPLSLVTLDLAGNNITSLDGIGALRALTALDISHNTIASMNVIKVLGTLPSLVALNVAGNPATPIDREKSVESSVTASPVFEEVIVTLVHGSGSLAKTALQSRGVKTFMAKFVTQSPIVFTLDGLGVTAADVQRYIGGGTIGDPQRLLDGPNRLENIRNKAAALLPPRMRPAGNAPVVATVAAAVPPITIGTESPSALPHQVRSRTGTGYVVSLGESVAPSHTPRMHQADSSENVDGGLAAPESSSFLDSMSRPALISHHSIPATDNSSTVILPIPGSHKKKSKKSKKSKGSEPVEEAPKSPRVAHSDLAIPVKSPRKPTSDTATPAIVASTHLSPETLAGRSPLSLTDYPDFRRAIRAFVMHYVRHITTLTLQDDKSLVEAVANGKVLCYLIHAFSPNSLDLMSVQDIREAQRTRLMAIETAHSALGVPPPLPELLQRNLSADFPDVVTATYMYLAQFMAAVVTTSAQKKLACKSSSEVVKRSDATAESTAQSSASSASTALISKYHHELTRFHDQRKKDRATIEALRQKQDIMMQVINRLTDGNARLVIPDSVLASDADEAGFAATHDELPMKLSLLTTPSTQRAIRSLDSALRSRISALGVSTGEVRDAQIQASSCVGKTRPTDARAGSQSCWMPIARAGGSLSIDFLEPVLVTAILVQGDPAGVRWVESFQVAASLDCVNWQSVSRLYQGNDSGNSATSFRVVPLDPLVHCRVIQIRPIDWHTLPALRCEVYGIRACDSIPSDIDVFAPDLSPSSACLTPPAHGLEYRRNPDKFNTALIYSYLVTPKGRKNASSSRALYRGRLVFSGEEILTRLFDIVDTVGLEQLTAFFRSAPITVTDTEAVAAALGSALLIRGLVRRVSSADPMDDHLHAAAITATKDVNALWDRLRCSSDSFGGKSFSSRPEDPVAIEAGAKYTVLAFTARPFEVSSVAAVVANMANPVSGVRVSKNIERMSPDGELVSYSMCFAASEAVDWVLINADVDTVACAVDTLNQAVAKDLIVRIGCYLFGLWVFLSLSFTLQVPVAVVEGATRLIDTADSLWRLRITSDADASGTA